jgi:membrane carboxypeptidase/penicillin-binding protein
MGPEGIWAPENYGGSSYGTLDLKSATSFSVNTVYAELISEVGPDKVADIVEAMGFSGSTGSGEVDPVCSLALGTLDVSPVEMARAYATFAARGVRPVVSPIRWIENGAGRCLLAYGEARNKDCRRVVDTTGERIVDENSADLLTETLTGVIEGGTATSAAIGRPAAGKTGTTQDARDAWFAGYVPQLATIVWMGYPVEDGPDGKAGTADDISPLMHYCGLPHCRPVHGIDVTGGSFPAGIWSMYMVAALDGTEIEYFTAPAYDGAIVLNPPPPPAPPEEDKDKDEGEGHDGDGWPGNSEGRGRGHHGDDD